VTRQDLQQRKPLKSAAFVGIFAQKKFLDKTQLATTAMSVFGGE